MRTDQHNARSVDHLFYLAAFHHSTAIMAGVCSLADRPTGFTAIDRVWDYIIDNWPADDLIDPQPEFSWPHERMGVSGDPSGRMDVSRDPSEHFSDWEY